MAKGESDSPIGKKDPEVNRELLTRVDYVYEMTGEIQATAKQLHMSPMRVKKLLITSGKLVYEETELIQRMLAYGMKMMDIQSAMGLGRSAINSYLPYSKVPYNEDKPSANASRCDLYRNRKTAVAGIQDEDTLWNAVRLFAGYVFSSKHGWKFYYVVETDGPQNTDRSIRLEKKPDKGQGQNICFEQIAKAYRNLMKDEPFASEYSDVTEEIFTRFKLIKE